MMKRTIFKKAAAAALAGVMVVGSAVTAQAAGWQKDDTGWRYYVDAGDTAGDAATSGTTGDTGTSGTATGTTDGTNGPTLWYANGWHWIDGNWDGLAECYCFDSNGYMYENTTTPDGHTVNGDGAWVENGVVQTKMVSVPAPRPVQDPNPEDLYGVRDYDSMGISKAAVDIALHTREENAKYTEVVTKSNGTTVQYANGLWADYYLSKDRRPTRVYAENDSFMIFQHRVESKEADVARLKAKGYAIVNWNLGGIYVEDIWDGRVTLQFMYPDCYMTVLSLKGRHRSDGVNMDGTIMNTAQLHETLGATWGTEWGY